MSYVKVTLCLLIYFTSLRCADQGQLHYLKTDIDLLNHPRLLFTQEREDSLKQIISKDSTWQSIHRLILTECDRMIILPNVEYTLRGIRLLEQSREIRKRIFYLAYAWRMTGDKKYLERAEEELLSASAFPDWNPAHFLDVAELTMAVSIGYDWLFKGLSETSRAIIQSAIIKKGLEPSLIPENNWWLTENSNWNQVCNAGMAFGAIAVYKDNPALARKIIDRSIASIQLPMKEYDPDGAYPEGYAYWTYGTTFNVYLVDALEKVFGTDFGLLEKSGFLKTAGYLANMVGPTGLNFNYSDGEAKGQLNPAMFWFATKLKDHTVLYSEKIFLANKFSLSGMRDLPAVMIFGAGVDVKNIPEPKKNIWVGHGKNPVALMRSGWDQEAIYIGLKGGSPDINHAHMDIGTFVMDAMGERWAMDFGGQDYNSLESKGIDLWNRDQESQRWKVFRYNNLVHNTLTFNQVFQRVKGHAPILHATDKEAFLSATTDLTDIYKAHASHVVRGVAIVNGRYVVVRDEIALANAPTTVRWTMLTAAQVTIIDRNTAVLVQNNKKLQLKVEEPATIELVTWSTQSANAYDEPNHGTTLIGFELTLPARSKTAFSVLLIPQPAEPVDFKTIGPLEQW
jgi:hypothetical protein